MKHHPTRRIAAHLLAVCAMLSGLPAATAADLTHLRCDYRDHPLGIDAVKPRLSWVIEESSQRSEDRSQKQTSYQVLIASTPELLAKDQGVLPWKTYLYYGDRRLLERAYEPMVRYPTGFIDGCFPDKRNAQEWAEVKVAGAAPADATPVEAPVTFERKRK
ncbi:MAG: hypothetical protein NTW21_05785 [Verrucomicrobia bacterium]|nr:hypothetical protein [Verrucomicrobiota bacterium]